MTTIPEWYFDDAGRVVAPRQAEHWRAAPGGAVDCTLCYRKCRIERSAAGWCGVRANDGGRLVIPSHGIVSSITRKQIGATNGADPYYYRPGALALSIGGVSCTAHCSFCISSAIALNPDRVPWVGGSVGTMAYSGGHYAAKAFLHPQGVVALAQQQQCEVVIFWINEPLLQLEYYLDAAALCKAAGLGVILYTNGYSPPAVIKRAAKHTDAVVIGIKGSLDPEFYRTWVRSEGATPHVKKAIRAWAKTDALLMVSDVIAPPQMQAEDVRATAQARLYSWLAEAIGPHTPVILQGMATPDAAQEQRPLLGAGASEADYWRHLREATARARAAGLVYGTSGHHRIDCHACGAPLLRISGPAQEDPPDAPMDIPPGWSFDVRVRGRHCAACGAAVPLVGN